MPSSPHLTFITGASRGLGAALAAQRLHEGHQVIGISRRASPELAALAAARGARLVQWTLDLTEPEPAAHQLAEWLGMQDPQAFASATLINNAGAITLPGPLADTPLDEAARGLRVGLEAALLLCAAFLHATQAWPVPRKVLNISSGLGRRAMAGSAVYCAAKAGMDHFTRAVALEQAALPNGARLSSLAPGVIDTDMQIKLRDANPAAFPERERFMQLQRLGQLDSPATAATKVLAYLDRPDFGQAPVADVRDA
ncbi:SDR family NAD(P)-dependent oxidoreductase [Ideonella sp.]|uniref:SDR family NAD(P)-dependent oxidoreductase n=1 Tax=Ideonella sp. TaxID=1929293 RepID=UPI002B46996C|nr:SDR family NAD(P)-dependent oxidoreductase [Ideonella sp.]HJV71262.1 SDR family NAD(P)-dependent oxidoreductase [Ideonella sp.]